MIVQIFLVSVTAWALARWYFELREEWRERRLKRTAIEMARWKR